MFLSCFLNITIWCSIQGKDQHVKCVQIRSFFCFLFSRVHTEHREIRSIFPYSVEVWKIRTRKNSVSGHFSRSGCVLLGYKINFKLGGFIIRKLMQGETILGFMVSTRVSYIPIWCPLLSSIPHTIYWRTIDSITFHKFEASDNPKPRNITVWKMSVFRVILVRIILHSEWMWRDKYHSCFSLSFQCFFPGTTLLENST